MEEPKNYAELLRAAIKSANSSRRKLSVQLAEKTGNKPETEYRSIGKYQAAKNPELPSRDRAAILAVLLGEPKLALVSDARGRRQDRRAKLEATIAEVARVQELLLDELALVVDEQGQLASRPSPNQDPKTRDGT